VSILSYNDIIACRSTGLWEDPIWQKTESITPQAAGVWHSFLNCAGAPSSLTITSAAGGAAMNSTYAGALSLSTPSTAIGRYLLSAGVSVPAVAGFSAMMLVDVLWGMKGIPLTATSFAIGSTALTRSTNGAGVQMMVVIDATAATASTLSLNYTDLDGTTRNTTCQLTTVSKIHAINPAGFAFVPISQRGVKSIQSIDVGTTIATKTISLFLIKPLIVIPTVAAYSFIERDATLQIEGITRLETGTDEKGPYLGWLGLAGGTGACASVFAQIRTVQG
jgi:hypothetical protein